jgi:hypothetical protein
MPGQYTERFTETAQLLAVTYPASYAAEQNTAFVNVGSFHRVLVLVIAGDIGTSLDVDVEIATDASATALHTLKSITQLTQAGGDDNSPVAIEIQTEDLVKPTGASATNYEWLRVESTPNGASIYTILVFGLIPRYAPVSTTIFDEIVD